MSEKQKMFTDTISAILGFAVEHQQSGSIGNFTTNDRAKLRKALTDVVNELADNLEAYELMSVGGTAVVGRNPVGGPQTMPVQTMQIKVHSRNYEITVRMQPPVEEALVQRAAPRPQLLQ